MDSLYDHTSTLCLIHSTPRCLTQRNKNISKNLYTHIHSNSLQFHLPCLFQSDFFFPLSEWILNDELDRTDLSIASLFICMYKTKEVSPLICKKCRSYSAQSKFIISYLDNDRATLPHAVTDRIKEKGQRGAK